MSDDGRNSLKKKKEDWRHRLLRSGTQVVWFRRSPGAQMDESYAPERQGQVTFEHLEFRTEWGQRRDGVRGIIHNCIK